MLFTEETAKLRTMEIYQEYKNLWIASPTWTTADKIHFDYVMNPEGNVVLERIYNRNPTYGWNELCNAAHLAWQIFFQEVVLPSVRMQ